MLTRSVGRSTYDAPMTTVNPAPPSFGRARISSPNWNDTTTDADYEDLDVIAANIERERAAARLRVTAAIAARLGR
jgi:hypothetical protein